MFTSEAPRASARENFSDGEYGMRKSIYCAGPMRGIPMFNFPAFNEVSTLLRAQGWDVRSPAEHDINTGFNPDVPLEEQTFDVSEAFRWDIEQLLAVDAVYFIDGWEGSQGATTEHAIAVSLGLQRLYQTPRDDEKYEYLDHVAYRRNK